MTPASQSLRIALCQINATVGDIRDNEAIIGSWIAQARDAGAALALFPELAVTGYPPEDLLLRAQFLRDAAAAIERLAVLADGIVVILGFPERREDVYNSAAVLAGRRVAGVHRKVYLPNYGVFDEQRYFQAGPGASVFDLGRHRIGLTVCEDIWEPGPPASDSALAGATLIANISASPYHVAKGAERERMVAQRARDDLASYAYCALVGGQDELVFDGGSFVVDHTGTVVARARQFAEELLVCDVDMEAPAAARLRESGHRPAARSSRSAASVIAALEPTHAAEDALAPSIAEPLAPVESEVYEALCLGLRDYVVKNGFKHVVLGLSGGVDSALVATIAVDALGAERVSVVVMPSEFSSEATQGDARRLADALGVECLELPIAGPMAAYHELLGPVFRDAAPGITEENLQARIRGNLLMALSNKFGWLVLTTGNKSEMSVGYSTLYGDSAGGFAVIKDVEKTVVYALASRRSGPDGPIPASILERAPSAELRPGQRDDDSLPSYDLLDAILRGYVEEDLDRDALLGRGLEAEEVDRVIGMVDRAEYKRRQAPPGIKITARAFGRDRRMPITNRYRPGPGSPPA